MSTVCTRLLALPMFLAAALPAAGAGEVILSDVVAGGDGSGNSPPENWGINPDLGVFEDEASCRTTHAIFNSGDNPQAVDDELSPYIDSVFIIESVPMAINSAGVVFEFTPGDANSARNTWDHILRDRTTDIDKGINDVYCNGQAYPNGVGMAGAAGITFDLNAIRAHQADPEDVSFFSSIVGQDRCGSGYINNYVLLSDDSVVFEGFYTGEFRATQGAPVQMLIPPEARYLTLAVGTVNGDLSCDHGVFALAKLSRAPDVLVTRDLPDTFLAGDTIPITLDVNVIKPTASVEIRERIPRSFIASSPANGGTIETAGGRQTVVWRLSGPAVVSQTLSYDLEVPAVYPNSTFRGGEVIAGGKTNPIVGEDAFKGGANGFVGEALVITLKQPTTGCAGNNPGLTGMARDYLTDGDAVSEVTIAPVLSESVSPDFGGASPALGSTSPTSLNWTRMVGQPGGWFQLNTCDECMSYVAFYVVVPPGVPLRVGIGSASDDSQQILVDGKEVWINAIPRGSGAAQVQDRSPLFDLSPGKHLVMQKVFEGCGGFDSAIRFEDEDMNPLLLQYTLDPAAAPAYEAGRAFVLREIPDGLDVGESGKVVLKLRVKEALSGSTIEENVPAGFAISAVSPGGAANGQKITWSIAGTLESADLSYGVAVPAGAIDSTFSGTAVLGGKASAILGDLSFSRGIMNPAGFIKHWLVLGPLDTFGLWLGDPVSPQADPHGPSATPEDGDLRADYLTDGSTTEKNIRPFDGMRISPAFGGNGVSGARAGAFEPLSQKACVPASPTWEAVVTPNGTFDNTTYYEEDINSHATYAACYLQNSTGAPISTNIAFHSDDNFIAFLNGVEVAAFESGPCSTDPALGCGRGYGAENEVANVAPVTLPPGESFLLTRVHDGFGGSGHRLRFQDAAGSPLLPPAVTVSLRSSASPPPVHVRRIISSGAYRFPERVSVTLRVEASGAHNVAIREILPPGFTAGDISHGGSQAAGAVEWTLNGASGTTDLAYKLVPGDCPGGGSFCGSQYTVDGTATHTLRGDDSFRRETRGTDDLGPWDARDIGSTGGGAQRVDGHAVDVTGKGAGVKLTKDEFRFISIPRTGDFQISARIDCMDDAGGSGQGGLMVRDTFDQFSAHVFFSLSSTPPEAGGVGTLKGVLRRETSKTRTSSPITISDKDVLLLPIHLRIERAAGKVSLQRSSDGVAYSEVATRDIGIGTTQVNLRNDTLVGLAVTGGGTGGTRIDYREVSGPEFPEESPPPAVILRAAAGDGQVTLNWEPQPGFTFTAFALHRDGAKIADLAAAERSYTDRGLANGRRYCYRISGLLAGGDTASSDQACATPQGGGPVRFRRGDADANGQIELTDAVKLLNYLFLGQQRPECLDAADVDDNGDADISDAISNLNYQFLGAAAPAPPGPAVCGPDPNAETPDLGCDKACI